MASSDLPASAEQQQVDSTDLRGPIPPQSVQLFRLFDLVKHLNAAGCSQKAPDHHHQSTLAWWRPSVTDLIVFFQHCNKRFEEQSGFSAQVFIRRHQPRVQIISLTQDRAHSPSRQTHPSCEALFGLLGFFFSKAAFKGNRIKAIIVFLRQWAVADRRDLQTEGWNSLQTGPLKVVVWLLSCSCLMTQTRWLAFLERHTVNYSWAGIRGVCVSCSAASQTFTSSKIHSNLCWKKHREILICFIKQVSSLEELNVAVPSSTSVFIWIIFHTYLWWYYI